jgi:outer membrane protein assembly factor BamB
MRKQLTVDSYQLTVKDGGRSRARWLAIALTVNCQLLTVNCIQSAQAADWPIWGGNGSRNMVSAETGLPTAFTAGQYKRAAGGQRTSSLRDLGQSEEIDLATTKNVRWVAKLGSQSYGNVTVAGGKVFLGTNNESPRDPRFKGDRSVVMCLDEKTGSFLWQLAIPKLGTGKVSDWEYLGICSSPAVEGDRVYVVTNRCEVVCLDANGQANGNDGPYKEEGQYLAGPGRPPVAVTPRDGDILWRFDMREELGVFPHNIASSSVLVLSDRLAVTTSNGVDWTHTTIPNPRAPALCVLEKATGKLLGEESVGISARTLHSNWSTPAYGKVGDQEMIIFGGGDGICYAFDVSPVKAEDGTAVLKELWRFDCNPPHYRKKNGKALKYATRDGPSEVLATPVFYNGRVYVAIGQDPEHGEGIGNLVCIDASKRGDITTSGKIWSYDKIARSISTVAIANGMVFAPDFSGFVHCVDAETGKPYWVFDSQSHIWGSPLVADGKVYFGTEDGDIIILAADKKLKEINRIDMRSPVYSTPVAANGTLYIGTQTHLYAIGGTTSSRLQAPSSRFSRTALPERTWSLELGAWSP